MPSCFCREGLVAALASPYNPAMAPPLLMLTDTHLTFGGTPLLEGADLNVRPGERLCLVGRNGSGKSTLLKIAAGLIESDAGDRFVQPGTTLRYLAQEPDFAGFKTAIDYVFAGLGPADDERIAHRLLERFNLSETQDPATMSGGEKRRAALARTLAPKPDILLLDEPTNHLDLPAIEWLEKELRSVRAALVLISHDRRLLETLSQSVLWLDRGKTRRLDEPFANFEDWRDRILEDETVNRHKLDRRIASEAEWVVKGVTGRRKRNMGRLRALQSLRQDRREQRTATGTVSMTVSDADMSSKKVIEVRNISKAYDGQTVVEATSLRILRGDRVGIVGPNGAGKTTLLNMIIGTLKPDAGTVKIASTVKLASLDQGRAALSPTETLEHALTGGGGDHVEVGGQPRHVIGYMKDFLFQPEQRYTSVSALSGGERARLMLARALSTPSNLLVLDEPTNDLDLETLDLLQEMLADYAGTVIVVSHDRDFLDRVATSVIASEGDGHWQEYAGGYSDMLTQRANAPKQGTDGDAVSPAKSSKSKPPKGAKPNRAKMTFKDQHALKTLPDTMAGLEAKIAAFEATLSDPTAYQRDSAAFDAATKNLSTTAKKLAAAEEEWLRLEMLREEINASR